MNTDATRDSSHKRLRSGKCRREGRYIPDRWVNIHPIEGGNRVASSTHPVTEYPRPLDQITALLNEKGLTGEFFCIWRDCCGQEQQKSTVVRATLNNILVEEV